MKSNIFVLFYLFLSLTVLTFTSCETPSSNDEIYEIEIKGADKEIERPGTQSVEVNPSSI